MKTIEVIIMNAFARDSGGGNPAAIVTNADGLTNPEKQAISKKLGLSETAFVSHSSVADYKLEFFTPTKQIAHCGHATIAAFSYLRESGVIKKDILTNETTDGLREIRFINGRAFMEQKSPAFSYPSDADAETILRSVNIKSDDLPVGTRPVIVNTGNSFLLIEVRSERALMHAKPHLDLISRVSEAYGLIGFYMFYRDSSGSSHATTRMFAPLYGIEEEAATVMAAGPL
ncbi:MAG: PhzF family phenazine biosynthesis protein, partial [Bacteroidia bacterium]|nr:PhzF family phenazine biosynthesis protein [Bacteroidia bacterium]